MIKSNGRARAAVVTCDCCRRMAGVATSKRPLRPDGWLLVLPKTRASAPSGLRVDVCPVCRGTEKAKAKIRRAKELALIPVGGMVGIPISRAVLVPRLRLVRTSDGRVES